jgi:hypothetical protein
MTPPRTTPPIRTTTLALVASLLLALPIASATSAPHVDASAVPFADAAVFSEYGTFAAGIDLAWDEGLVLNLGAPGQGHLGDVQFSNLADLPTNALGEIVTAEAVRKTGLVSNYPGGVVFTASGTSVDAVTAAFAKRLAELGFTVDHEAGARTLLLEHDGHVYRAVFGAHANGVQVYLGN